MIEWTAVSLMALAIWILGNQKAWSRWGYVIGLVSQVFWIAQATRSNQLWLLAAALIITISFTRGFLTYFFVNRFKIIKNKVNIERLW